MRLDELCDSYHKELCDYLRETNERQSGSIQDPVQVSHSEIPSPVTGEPTQCIR
jgi:hypothetical protein